VFLPDLEILDFRRDHLGAFEGLSGEVVADQRDIAGNGDGLVLLRDSQKDMALAVAGACVSLLLVSLRNSAEKAALPTACRKNHNQWR
jgi:hypothetical protein